MNSGAAAGFLAEIRFNRPSIGHYVAIAAYAVEQT